MSSRDSGLRIVVDALAARTGGGRRVAFALARGLAHRSDVAHVWLLMESDVATQGSFVPDDGLSIESVEPGTKSRLLRRLLWESFKLPRMCRRVRADAVLGLSGMLPRRLPCPIIAMPQNSLVFESGALANRMRRYAVLRTARLARRVVVASNYMADLIDRGVCVQVAPHGIDHDLFRPAPVPGEELIYVSDFYEHKRHELLIAAWERLPKPRPTLRLVGNTETDPALAERVRGRAERVDRERFVLETLEPAAVPGALVRARVAVIPSIRESFCHPMIEAAACGVPVIARDIPALRETGGPGATYVRGDDPAEWATSIRSMLADEIEHKQAREASIAYARAFTWDSKAEAVIAAITAD
jgi:glycosyltransferase involved in cell wall biosynthesis